jgi:hypothetical protein
MNVARGDKLVISIGDARRVLTLSAVDNRVVKYFDEANSYGQMPLNHLATLLDNNQAEIVRGCPD